MPEHWVVNASPLILLAKIEHVHLLEELADQVIVPEAVLAEVNNGPIRDPARRFLAARPLQIVPVAPHPMIAAWDLGEGEAGVLGYATRHPGWKAIIDDGAARRCARALGIPHLGTLGVILRARQSGLIAAAVPLLRALRIEGIRLDDAVIRAALAATSDETWE